METVDEESGSSFSAAIRLGMITKIGSRGLQIMRVSRYLDVKVFCDEAKKLKVAAGGVSEAVLERLEEQNLLVSRLRLRYPDSVERRWWAESHEYYQVEGEVEPNSERWDNANDLEKARQRNRLDKDPTVNPHVLDDPEPRFAVFIQQPTEMPFVPWRNYRVLVGSDGESPFYSSDTVVSYYSAWQLLQFTEVVNMGVLSFMNLFDMPGWPSNDSIVAAPKLISVVPVHVTRCFKEHAIALDSIVWFAEEAELGYYYSTRQSHSRRLVSKTEREEITRTRVWAAEQAQRRYNIGSDALLGAVRFLCERWAYWNAEGRPLIADAYKTIAGHGVGLACLATGMTFDQYGVVVGRVGGYFKPILNVIWPNWATEQRDGLKRVFCQFRSENAPLRAEFNDALIDRFLSFVEENSFHGLYWRMESFHHHFFEGNVYSLEGMKGDVQGVAVILEHIASALILKLVSSEPGADPSQLYEKFKKLWRHDRRVLNLLKDDKVRHVAYKKSSIDLGWFEVFSERGRAESVAGDLAISFAIRGTAHHVIDETDPFKLELMMLILLRAMLRTFEAATSSSIANL